MLRLFSIDFRSATGINAVMLNTTYVQLMHMVPFGLLTLKLALRSCVLHHNSPVFYHRAHSTPISCGSSCVVGHQQQKVMPGRNSFFGGQQIFIYFTLARRETILSNEHDYEINCRKCTKSGRHWAPSPRGPEEVAEKLGGVRAVKSLSGSAAFPVKNLPNILPLRSPTTSGFSERWIISDLSSPSHPLPSALTLVPTRIS